MPAGTVRLFNDITGSGFIDPDDGSPAVKVSYRSIASPGYKILYESQRVTFDVVPTPRGPVAVNVVPADG
ncbi:MAG: cold shock domain-containing protein [Chitinispirillaceae bacterium]|jgi:CspA family cold shock protein